MIHFAPVATRQLELLSRLEAQATPHQPWSLANLEGSHHGGECFLIMRETDMIGYYAVRLVLDDAELLNIVIFKPWQRCGYGRRAVRALQDNLARKGVKQLFLEVRVSNRAARALYRSTGFEQVGRRRNYYRAANNFEPEDALIMRCFLPETGHAEQV